MTPIFKVIGTTLARSKSLARPVVRAAVHSDGPCMWVSKQMARRNPLENWFQDCCAKLRENDVPLKISKISHPRMLKMRFFFLAFNTHPAYLTVQFQSRVAKSKFNGERPWLPVKRS